MRPRTWSNLVVKRLRDVMMAPLGPRFCELLLRLCVWIHPMMIARGLCVRSDDDCQGSKCAFGAIVARGGWMCIML